MKDLSLPVEKRTHAINVMERIVVQAVEQQLQQLPLRVCRYIKREEVITYALNRLPTLYASSEKGLRYQCQLAEQELKSQISDAVRQAIVAVQVDPIRIADPIRVTQNKDAEAVLVALRTLFKMPDLDWEGALAKLNSLKRQPGSATNISRGRRHPRGWQPGVHGQDVAWTRRHQTPLPESDRPSTVSQDSKTPSTQGPSSQPAKEAKSQNESGWDDVRYTL